MFSCTWINHQIGLKLIFSKEIVPREHPTQLRSSFKLLSGWEVEGRRLEFQSAKGRRRLDLQALLQARQSGSGKRMTVLLEARLVRQLGRGTSKLVLQALLAHLEILLAPGTSTMALLVALLVRQLGRGTNNLVLQAPLQALPGILLAPGTSTTALLVVRLVRR